MSGKEIMRVQPQRPRRRITWIARTGRYALPLMAAPLANATRPHRPDACGPADGAAGHCDAALLRNVESLAGLGYWRWERGRFTCSEGLRGLLDVPASAGPRQLLRRLQTEDRGRLIHLARAGLPGQRWSHRAPIAGTACRLRLDCVVEAVETGIRIIGTARLIDDDEPWSGELQARLAAAAEQAERARAAFQSGMSHELRTPLNAVIGFSELMLSETLGPIGNERYRDYLGDILASGRHLLTLVEHMLRAAHPDEGRTG
jgi:signal transduction histidine kinase